MELVSLSSQEPLFFIESQKSIGLCKEETNNRLNEHQDLVHRARSGDREAFGELVRYHRSQALGWAHKIAQDSCIAEDIVQEALIRAFIHIGNLMNAERFVPWLQRIVRNQAYMKMRRGGPYGKERPFSDFSRNVGDTSNDNTNWTDIDEILLRLSRSATENAQLRDDPSVSLVRADMLQCLRELLSCLGKRERAIFEAHFFDELTPAEIASLLSSNLTLS